MDSQTRIESLERRARRLRQAIAATPSFLTDLPESTEDKELGEALRATLAELAEARQSVPANVGPYSGLTRAELGKTGTCETDWI